MKYAYPVSDVKIMDHLFFEKDTMKNRFVDTMPMHLWTNGLNETSRNLWGWFGALPSEVL